MPSPVIIIAFTGLPVAVDFVGWVSISLTFELEASCDSSSFFLSGWSFSKPFEPSCSKSDSDSPSSVSWSARGWSGKSIDSNLSVAEESSICVLGSSLLEPLLSALWRVSWIKQILWVPGNSWSDYSYLLWLQILTVRPFTPVHH